MKKVLGLVTCILCTSSAFSFVPASLHHSSTSSPPRRQRQRRVVLGSTKALLENADNHAILKEIEGLTATFVDVQKTIESSAQLYESKLSEYEQQIGELSNEISQANTVILQKELQLEDLKKVTEQNTDQAQSSKTKVADIESDLESKRKEVEALSQQLQEKQTLLTEQEGQMNSIQDELKAVTVEYETLKVDVTDQYDLIAATQAENAALLEQVSNLQQQAEEAMLQFERMKNEYESEINALKSDMETQKKASTGLDTLLLKEEQTRTKALEQMLSTAREDLEETIMQAAAETESLQNKISSLERELNEINPSVQDVQLRNELIDVRAQSYKELMDVRLKMTTSKDKVNRLTEQVQKYEAERRSLRKLTVLGIKRVLTLVTFGVIGSGRKKVKKADKKNEEEQEQKKSRTVKKLIRR